MGYNILKLAIIQSFYSWLMTFCSQFFYFIKTLTWFIEHTDSYQHCKNITIIHALSDSIWYVHGQNKQQYKLLAKSKIKGLKMTASFKFQPTSCAPTSFKLYFHKFTIYNCLLLFLVKSALFSARLDIIENNYIWYKIFITFVSSHIKMMPLSDPTCAFFIAFIYVLIYVPWAGISIMMKLSHFNINEWNSLVNWYTINIENCKIVMAFQQSLGYIPTSPNKEHVGSDMCIILMWLDTNVLSCMLNVTTWTMYLS